MPRVKRGTVRRAKRKKLLGLAKGYYANKSKLYRAAKESVDTALKYAFVGRRRKKRDFRRLWVVRINAAAREHGLTYGQFISGLKRAGVTLDRKSLSELAISSPGAFAELATKATFGVTELERFADCSSIWFLDRLIDPKSIDARVDARLRGQVAHQVLFKFYSGLPKELGADRVEQDRVEDAVAFLRRCLDDAMKGVRLEFTELQERELRHGLWRDLEAFVREEAAADMPLLPRRFEVLFGSERSAPELQRGLELAEGITLSGKIDRIDVDPFSARGIVQDYKAGKHAHSAQQIESEKRLQIPLYMLVLRDLVGVEPLGGLYRPLSGERKARGLLRAEAREDGIPGFAKNDYLAEEEFWSKVEGARGLAVEIVDRIRTGDVQHDPKGGDCPTWCELASMCRIKRA